MPKRKKLSLGDLRVNSFVTSSEQMGKIEGGGSLGITGCAACDTRDCVTYNTCYTDCGQNTCYSCPYTCGCTWDGPC